MPKKKDRRRRFGSIVKRPREGGGQRYQARWVVDGKRTERSFDTKAEAEACLAKMEREHIAGRPPRLPTLRQVEANEAARSSEMPTFVAYAQKHIDEYRARRWKPTTVELNRHNLAALSEYFGERTIDGVTVPAARLDEITLDAADDYKAWRLSHPRTTRGGRTGVKEATVNRDLCFLKVVLNYAVRKEILTVNPVRELEKYEESEDVRQYFSAGEADRLIDACDPRFRPIVVIAFDTGVRKSELQSLTWQYVNLETRKVGIVRTKVKNADWLDLTPRAATELKRLREARPEARPSDSVFLNSQGRPWRDYRRAWHRAMKRAGLSGRTGYSFHSTRHTFAVEFLTAGGAIVDLKAQLGHRRIETTLRYSRVVDERRRSTIMRMYANSTPDAAPVAPPEMGDRKGDWSVREAAPEYAAHDAA